MFATCISAAVATLVMGLYANYPLALAPGMSLNAYFTYSVCFNMHVPWRTALAVVFISGVVFLLLTVSKVREQIVNGIPECLKHSTATGIGMFIAFVGMRNAKLVVANPATFVGLGSFSDPEVQTACFGLVLTLILMVRKYHGAILIGIFGATLLGMLRGISKWPTAIFSMPHPSGTLFQLDFRSAIHLGLLEIMFAFFFVDLFDNVGTLVAVCEQGGFIGKDGKIPRVGRALVADAVGTVVGSLNRYVDGYQLYRKRGRNRRRRAYGIKQCGSSRSLFARNLLLAAGDRDSRLRHRPGSHSGGSADDAIHRPHRLAGLNRSGAGLHHHAGHAPDLQHRNRPEPGVDLLHGRKSRRRQASRGQLADLDSHGSIHLALHLSCGELGKLSSSDEIGKPQRAQGSTEKQTLIEWTKEPEELEARVRIELTYKGFADLSLTTWVPRPAA